MNMETVEGMLQEAKLTRSSLARETHLSKGTIDSWFSKKTFPSWLESWLQLYAHNQHLLDELKSKDITIKELSKLISSESSHKTYSYENKKIETKSTMLYCRYAYVEDTKSIDDVYKVEITTTSGNRTFCRWLFNGKEGSLSKIASEIQKIRNPSNQNPSINGNDYFVNENGVLYSSIKDL